LVADFAKGPGSHIDYKRVNALRLADQPGSRFSARCFAYPTIAMQVYQLIYKSQSLVPFEEPELLALLQQARTFNRDHGITGLLLYTPDGRFMQVLEGSQPEVRALYYNHIALDPRHFNCLVICEGFSPKRSFTEWSMCFRMAQAHHLRTLLGYVKPDSPALLVPRPHTRPELLTLLQDFLASSHPEPQFDLN
jgi:hypothetical protein